MASEREQNQDPKKGKSKFNLKEKFKKMLKNAKPKRKKKRKNNRPESVKTQLSGRAESVQGYEVPEPPFREIGNTDPEIIRAPNHDPNGPIEGRVWEIGNKKIFVEKFELNPKTKKDSETNTEKLDNFLNEAASLDLNFSEAGHSILNELERPAGERMETESNKSEKINPEIENADMNTLDRIQREKSVDLSQFSKPSNKTHSPKTKTNRTNASKPSQKTKKGSPRISF